MEGERVRLRDTGREDYCPFLNEETKRLRVKRERETWEGTKRDCSGSEGAL